MEDSKIFPLKLTTIYRPIFRLDPSNRYEDILESGREIISDSKELTFVLRENMIYREFRRNYTSPFKWTLSNYVTHVYKLIDDYLYFHGEQEELFFIDGGIYGVKYIPSKKEIIIDES